MTDEKKPVKKAPAKTAAKIAEGKPAAKKPVGRPRTSTRKPPTKKLNKPQSRSIEPVTQDAPPPTDQTILDALNDGLTPKEIAFVEAYMTCWNGTKAWLEVYGTANIKSAQSQSSYCINKPMVKKYLAIRMAAAFQRTEEAQDKLIQSYQYMAYGDANELVEFRRTCCRYCYGEGFRYQRTQGEMDSEREAWEEKLYKAAEDGKPTPADFDEKGGVGFKRNADPNPECPECQGEGVGDVFFKDTRNLSPAALAMYTGAKVGKEGIEIKMTSREKASDMLAKILKLAEDKTEVNFNFSKDELDDKFASKMQQARARMAKVREERGLPGEDE